MALDTRVRSWLRPLLDRIARALAARGVTALQLTLLGLVLGIASGIAAAFGRWELCAVLWLVSRLADGLDGPVADAWDSSSDLGGFLDIMADFTSYGGFVVGCAVRVPEAQLAFAVLLFTYYLNGTAFLAISSLAERRAQQAVEDDGRSLQFVGGLAEGTETIVAHLLMAGVGSVDVTWLDEVVWGFAAVVGFTVIQRIVFGIRLLRE